MNTTKGWTTEREIAHVNELLEYWQPEQFRLREKADQINKTLQSLADERHELLARLEKEKHNV